MAEQEQDIAGFVSEIISSLVDEPEQVEVASSAEPGVVMIRVKVAPSDVGKVIGRQGRIIKAIRTLARAVSSYTGGAHVEVEVVG